MIIPSEDTKRVYDEVVAETGAYYDIKAVLDFLRRLFNQRVEPHKDKEQSWKPVKGRILEDLVGIILSKVLESSVLRVVRESKLNKDVKAALEIDYHTSGKHIPDADLIVYRTDTLEPVAILSVKSSLRERIAQVAYWTIKIEQTEKNIAYYFVTTDLDDVFRKEDSKPRAIAEQDLQGVYVISPDDFEPFANVKHFSHLAQDLLALIASSA